MEIDQKDVEALRREKYGGAKDAPMTDDLARLENGEPLAYVIGNVPFLDLTIDLSSHPLIPRPETEWWTELLINHLNHLSHPNHLPHPNHSNHPPNHSNHPNHPNTTIYGCIGVGSESGGMNERKDEGVQVARNQIRVLDVCAGSGAIGLALLKHCPQVHVSFGELSKEHAKQIQKNLKINTLDASRADVRSGNLFEPFKNEKFNIIAVNPPYIPSIRTLSESVTDFEPAEALYGGKDGLSIITEIVREAPSYLSAPGELWMECDIENIDQASFLAMEYGASYTKIRTDPYGRPRLLVAYY